MPRFVISGDFFFFFRKDMASAFRTEHDFFYRTYEVVLRNFCAIFTRGKYSALVHKRIQISTRESRSSFGNDFQIDIFGKWLFCTVYGQNIFTILTVRQVKCDTSIKSSWTQKGGVQNIWSICCSHNNDFFVWLKAVP